jgi:protein involved in polysaccharide export with SLBB domain
MLRNKAFLFIAVSLGFLALSRAQSAIGSDSEQPPNCNDPANAAIPYCQGNSGQGIGNPQTSPLNGQQNPGSMYPPLAGATNPEGNSTTYQDNGGASRPSGIRSSGFPAAPPEPLTEFQKFVAATTEQVLPIFGQDLFRGVPSTFAPVDQIPVTPDYVVGPGDQLRIRVWGKVNFNADVTVDRSGDVYVPQVGRIHVSGLPFAGLNQHIRSEIGRIYKNFDLTVDLGQLRSIQIFVVGQARRPGSYTVSSLSTLVNALFASGGPSVQGTMRDIQVKRDGAVIGDFDLYDLLIRGDKSKDVRLLPGDVIFIPAVGPQVALMGSVRKPAIYELKSGESLTTMQQLLDSAGGLSTVASSSRISIERVEDRQTRQAMEIPLDAAGLGTPVRDGDLIRVLSMVPSYAKTVTLRGNLANPGRFEWHPGMKLSDLIPDRASLITRDYWWHKAQLGLPAVEFEPLQGRGPLVQPTNPSYLPRAVNPAMQRQRSQYSQSQDAQSEDYFNQRYQQQENSSNQNPDSPYNSGVNGSGFANQNGNTPYPANQRTAPAAPNEAGAGTLAAQESQTVTQNQAAARGKVEVKLSSPEIDWSYAVIERLDPDTLKTSLLSFNLGKLVIDHDPTQDLPLQPGDVVTIFSQADIRVPLNQQTKFVRLEGEFVSAGVYSVAPGETLRQLVQRAGGFTSNAYLFGSEFTRESTRIFQQQRLDEYIQSLELQIQRSGITLAASAVGAQDTAAAGAANLSQQGLLSRLHQLKASGRIVLEVKPNSSGLDAIPDIQLQDDDRFVVPSRPATVNVVGAVYDQNSFLYRPGSRVGDYLRLSGGPNRVADKKHIFIIRADGSVIGRDSANGLWGNNFEAIRLNPGDSIIVPEKIIGPSVLRNLVNWSQVFSQLALGAAAINVL